MPSLTVNGQIYNIEADPLTPVLWLIRDVVGLKGTKFGCGVGVCGACTALVNGVPQSTCNIVLADIGSASITTIEGLSADSSNPLQLAWPTNHTGWTLEVQTNSLNAGSIDLLSLRWRGGVTRMHKGLRGHEHPVILKMLFAKGLEGIG